MMHASMNASLNGNPDTVVFLVEHGANIAHTDSEGMTALYCASPDGNLLLVKSLLRHGARTTERSDDGSTAFLQAGHSNDHFEVIRYLLSFEGGASIKETDYEGNTALLQRGCGEAGSRTLVFVQPCKTSPNICALISTRRRCWFVGEWNARIH
jgi:ankyrin repeat protein